MKKLVSIIAIFSIVPGISMGYSAKYNRLVSEKQRKIEELEKCTGNVNGWKIAGISTLGLTAVGVAGNVALANEGKEYDKKLEKADKSLNDLDTKIENKKAEIAAETEKKAAEEACTKSGGTWSPTDKTCTCDKKGIESKGGVCVRVQDKVEKITALPLSESENGPVQINEDKRNNSKDELYAVINGINTCPSDAKPDGNTCKCNDTGKEYKDGKCVETTKQNKDNSKTKSNAGAPQKTTSTPATDTTKAEPKPSGCTWLGGTFPKGQKQNFDCSSVPANKDRLLGGTQCSCECLYDGKWECEVSSCDTKNYNFVGFSFYKPYGHCEEKSPKKSTGTGQPVATSSPNYQTPTERKLAGSSPFESGSSDESKGKAKKAEPKPAVANPVAPGLSGYQNGLDRFQDRFGTKY